MHTRAVDGDQSERWRAGARLLRSRVSSPGLPALCAAVAFVVFLAGISAPSLWIDEGHTWAYAERSLGSILSTTLGQTNAVEAPYYLFLHLWIRVAGDSELSLRLPSALAMALAVWATAKVAFDAAGTRAALAAGFVMVALPGVTRYAQEARPYAFVVAGVAMSTFFLMRGLTRSERRWWVGYGASIAAVGYFHVLSLLVLAGHLAIVVLVERQRWRPFLVAAALALLSVAPIAALGFAQRGQIAWIPPVQFDWLWTGLSVLTGSLAASACIGLIAVYGSGRSRLFVVGLPTAIATPTLLWTIGHFGPWYLARYLLGAAPGIALVAAAGLESARGVRAPVIAGLLVALVLPQQISLRDAASHGQDYRSAAQLVATDCSAAITYDGMSQDAMTYYLRDQSCAPSEGSHSDRLWVVQAEGPQISEPGYQLLSSDKFGSALVTYWATK